VIAAIGPPPLDTPEELKEIEEKEKYQDQLINVVLKESQNK
jgi:hypothetical protein